MIIEICRNVLWKLIKSVDFLLKYSYNLISKNKINKIYYQGGIYMFGQWMGDNKIIIDQSTQENAKSNESKK